MERIWVVEYDMGGGVVGICGNSDAIIGFSDETEAQDYAEKRGKIYSEISYVVVPYVREEPSR